MSDDSTETIKTVLRPHKTAQVLRKHVATVHISAPLTLKERIAVNVLLANAMEQGMDSEDGLRAHHISLESFNKIVFGGQGNSRQIKNTLDGLLHKSIQWSYTDEDERKVWGASTWLAGYNIKNHVVHYSYSAQITEKILDPRIFARLNFSIQHQLKSRHAQALYENCARYRERGETKVWTIETFRKLMSVENKYTDFKELNRNIIKPATKELNKKTEIFVEPVLMKTGHRYEKIMFRVSENTEYTGPTMPPITSFALNVGPEIIEDRKNVYERLVAYGVDPTRAGLMLKEFSDQYINENLDIVSLRLQAAGSNIRNLGGYVVNALKHDYRPDQEEASEQVERETPERKARREEREKEDEIAKQLWQFEKQQLPKWRVSAWEQSLGELEAREYRNRFYTENVKTNMLAKRLWEVDPNSTAIKAIWTEWVKKQILPEPSEDERVRAAEDLGVPLVDLRSKMAEIRARRDK